MSIALNQRIKDLERKVQEQADSIAWLRGYAQALEQRILTIESRPKPGRPPKNGV